MFVQRTFFLHEVKQTYTRTDIFLFVYSSKAHPSCADADFVVLCAKIPVKRHIPFYILFSSTKNFGENVSLACSCFQTSFCVKRFLSGFLKAHQSSATLKMLGSPLPLCEAEQNSVNYLEKNVNK